MMRTIAALVVALASGVGPAIAQDQAPLDFGRDRFHVGSDVVVDAPGLADAFLAGERIEITAPIEGAAHLAGRRVETTAAIGGALYAMGQDVRVAAPVAGAASLAGYDVVVSGAIGGNLRVFGRNVDLQAPVAGTALITGENVTLAGVVGGDAAITAERLSFGEGARIDGRLTLYEDPDAPIVVPDSVVPLDRIERRELRDAVMMEHMTGPGWGAIAIGLLLGMLLLAALATVAAAVAPRSMVRLGAIVSDKPFRTIGFGFLVQSALIGGAVLLALTLIGVLVAPFVVLAAVLLGALGYIVATYLLGERIVTHFGALESDTLPEYARSALVGALIAGLLSLVPFIGWLAMIALSLAGVGAMAIARFRPRYGV